MKLEQLNHDSLKMTSLFKQIMKIALPMALQGVLLSMVQLIDNLFIGHLESATNIAAGINAINNITFIMSSIVIGFMSGIGVYFAQAAGKGDEKVQKQLFIAKVVWTIIWAVLLIVIVAIFLPSIAKIWLPSNENITLALQAASNYGLIIIPSLLIDYGVMIYSSSFKEKKQTWVAMWVAMVAIVINASLNYPLMYSAKLGVQGSAIATLIARFFELLIWIIYVLKKRPPFLPKWIDFKMLKFKEWWAVFPKSFWWMINGLITNLAFTLQIMFMSRLSLDAGGALNSAGVVAQLVYAFTNGYATAINIIIMHHLAQNKNLDLKQYNRKLQIISIFFGLVMGLILASFSPTIFYLYPNYNYNTKMQAMIMLWSISSTLWVSLAITVYVSIFKGVGFAKMVVILDGFYSWLITLPITIILVYLAKDQIDFGYIYWIVSATIIIKPFILAIFFKLKHKNFKALVINLQTKENHKWKK